MFDRVDIFLMKKGLHYYYESKKAKKGYATVLLFILYSVWVCVENPNKMICLKSPK